MSKLIYIPQDSCIFYHPNKNESAVTLYTDGAASGILLALTGTDADGQPLAALAHLTGAFRFRRFFQQAETRFAGQTALTACGADPAAPVNNNGILSYDSIVNVSTLLEWVTPLLNYPGKDLLPPRFCIAQTAFRFGCGQHCLCIRVDACAAQPFEIGYDAQTVTYRDPVSLLASLFGIKTMLPSLILHEADRPFSKSDTDALVWEARRAHWDSILSLSDAQLMQQFCNASDAAPEWYASLLRDSARYVADYGETADGIGRRTIQF